MNVQPHLFGEGWLIRRDGDDTVRAIFDRHYSRYHHADGRRLDDVTIPLFAGGGIVSNDNDRAEEAA